MKENNYNILLSEFGTKGMEEKIRFVAVLWQRSSDINNYVIQCPVIRDEEQQPRNFTIWLLT